MTPVRKPTRTNHITPNTLPRGPVARQPVCSNIDGLTLKTKFWLEIEGRFVIGEGGIALLLEIARQGSLAKAAREVGWSYRHAWGYLRRAERTLGAGLTDPRQGNGSARGMALTQTAQAMVRAFTECSARAEVAQRDEAVTLGFSQSVGKSAGRWKDTEHPHG